MFKKTKFTTLPLTFSLLLLLLVSACVPLEVPTVDASSMLEIMAEYDPEVGELPEGIAIDSEGNIYISLAPLGELRRIAPDGTETLVATLDPEGGFGLLGLGVDDADNVYAAVGSNNPEINGVHRITPDGESARLVGSEEITLPNAIAFDPNGDVYVTATILGAIWRFPQDGEAELWLQDALLEGTEAFEFGVPLGANGIAYRDRAFYIANTEKGHIVRIPVNDDGDAGRPEILIAHESLSGADGIVFDRAGDLYVVSVSGNTLLKIKLSAGEPAITILASAEDGLDNPASLAFGTSPETSQTIYLTNFALISEEKHPGIVTYVLNQ